VGTYRPVVVEERRRFPRRVDLELARRRAPLLEQASGRILDLDRADHRHEVARAIAGDRPTGHYDTAVSVAQLVRFPDLGAALRAIDRLLGPQGVLMAVEPVGRPGFVPLLVRSLLAAHPALRGMHVGRDLPAAVRTTSLVLDDIERFTMPTPLVPLREAVAVRACRIGPWGERRAALTDAADAEVAR
jgi:hypothetical protein